MSEADPSGESSPPPLASNQPASHAPWERLSGFEAGVLQDRFQQVVDAAVALTGFEVAALGVVDAAGVVDIAAVSGSDEARAHFAGARIPLAELLVELEHGEQWGSFTFVAHDRRDLRAGSHDWVPDPQWVRASVAPRSTDKPEAREAWHRFDLLVAPLRDERGVVRALISLDLPVDGLRPGGGQQRVLAAFGEQCAQGVTSLMESQDLARRAWSAELTRRIVHTAVQQQSLQHVVETSRAPLLDAFGALGMWVHTLLSPDVHGSSPRPVPPTAQLSEQRSAQASAQISGQPVEQRQANPAGESFTSIYSADGRTVIFTHEIRELTDRVARTLWSQRQAMAVTAGRTTSVLSNIEEHQIQALLAELDLSSVVLAPIGIGERCLGHLVLTRPTGAPGWTSTDVASAAQVGRDLGVAITYVRAVDHHVHRATRSGPGTTSGLPGADSTGSLLSTSSEEPAASDDDAAQTEQTPEPALGGEPDVARTRMALRAAGDEREQVGRRRDAQARIVADNLLHGDAVSSESLRVYGQLSDEYRDAHLFWQVAYDAWHEVHNLLPESD